MIDRRLETDFGVYTIGTSLISQHIQEITYNRRSRRWFEKRGKISPFHLVDFGPSVSLAVSLQGGQPHILDLVLGQAMISGQDHNP